MKAWLHRWLRDRDDRLRLHLLMVEYRSHVRSMDNVVGTNIVEFYEAERQTTVDRMLRILDAQARR